MKKKNRILSGFLSVMLICSMFSPYAYAEETNDVQKANSELTPEDLHFRKFFTGRNLFDSEIPVKDLDLESVTAEGSQYADGRLIFQNSGEQNAESKVQLGDSLTPYSVYDLEVTKQGFSEQGASVAEILWEQDENNSISLKRAAVPEKEPEIVQGELIESLDLNDDQILENHTITSEVAPKCEFTNGPGWLKVASGGSGTGEAYLHVGNVIQNSYIDVSVSEQIKKGYSANALVRLRKPSASGKNSGIFICQRANGTMTAEILIDGASKRSVTISDQGVEAPYDFRVAVVGNEIQVTRFKDGKISAEGTLDATGIYDLNDPDVLADFEYVIGGRLAAEESVTFTKADIYQLPEKEKELSSFDMSDPDLLDKVDVYHDLAPYNSAQKVTGGIKLNANGDRGESYINAGALKQDTVLEATITEQTVSGYTASAILKFRDKSVNNAKSNGIYLTQRAAAGGNKTYGLEVIVNGTSVKNIAVAANAVTYPFKLRLALHGNIVVASRVVDGKEQGFAELDVSEWFDLKDPEVLKNFEATAGAKLGKNESMTYSDISIKEHTRDDGSALPTEDNGIILQVKKGGSMALNKVIHYPSKLQMDEPYTLRAHWAGQYLCIWIIRDGKPYLLSSEDMGAYFDMRKASVYSGFRSYMRARLAKGAELEVSAFRNYYTGGDGQADPKPLHYKDGTVMVEDGKMWISMTLRGYQPLPASCQAIYSFDLQTYELKLVNITTFKKPGDEKEWAYHASDFCYDEDEGRWIVVTSSHGDDKLLRAGILPSDPRKTPYMSVDVDVLTYEVGARSNYEDPSIIYDKEAGKWRIATCFSGSGGFNVGLIEADNFNVKASLKFK